MMFPMMSGAGDQGWQGSEGVHRGRGGGGRGSLGPERGSLGLERGGGRCRPDMGKPGRVLWGGWAPAGEGAGRAQAGLRLRRRGRAVQSWALASSARVRRGTEES